MTIETHTLREELTLNISADQIPYINNRVGSLVTNVNDALNYLFASLFPNFIGTYATPASLPVASLDNDYAFIVDDGDGHSAGYIYSVLDGVSGWVKRYDVDWSRDSLLSTLLSETHPLYVLAHGRESGQTIYGGTATGGNLEFNANSLDDTGKIITKNTLEPKIDNSIDLGELTKRFKDIFLNGQLKDGVISLSLANIKAAFDHISLTNNPHSTTYNNLVSKLGTVTFGGDITGTIDLSTSGNKSSTIIVGDDSHTHTKLTLPNFDYDVYTKIKSALVNNDGITFAFNDTLQTITPSEADIDTTQITNIDDPAANKILASNTAGNNWAATTLTTELLGDVTGSATFNSTTGKVSITTTAGHVYLKNIDGINLNSVTVTISTHATNATVNKTNHQLNSGDKVYLDSSIIATVSPQIKGEYTISKVDANNFTIVQACTVGGNAYMIANNAQLLFDTATQKFIIRREFAEIAHTELENVDLNDDHLQYVRKDGRITGQSIIGGTDTAESLTLESTAHATKGKVKTKDSLVPFATALYSGTWSGVDLGSPANKFRHIYTSGELIGARLENLTSTPASSGQNLGRILYNTVDDKVYYDNGTRFKALSTANVTTIIVVMSNSTSTLVDLTSTLDVDKFTADYTWVLNDSTTSQFYNPTIARTTTKSVTINSEIALTGTFVLKGI